MSFLFTVITNAGPLMALGKLNRLGLLYDLFETVQMPQAVYTEVVSQGLRYGEPDARLVRRFWRDKNWPIVQPTPEQKQAITLHAELGLGEQEVLALANAQRSAIALMDDKLARTEARRLNIHVYGTLGIIIQAYRKQIIPFTEVSLTIEEIIQRPDIWISQELCHIVLDQLKSEIAQSP